MGNMERNAEFWDGLLITNSLASTLEINFDDYASATLHFPDDWTSATLTVYSWDPASGEFLPLYDSSGTAVTMASTASTARVMADAIFPSSKIKIVSNQSGNNAKAVGMTLKG